MSAAPAVPDPLADLTRQGLRQLARSVSVITLAWEGRRLAMAATAVEGLSLDPPAMLICVNRSASLAAPLLAGAGFCINLLGLSHRALPAQCSSPNQGEARFETGRWTTTPCGQPRLGDAAASFLCANERQVEYGTHLIVIGRVREVTIAEGSEPLVYAHGAYHGLRDIRPETAA
jgi:flavin reductase (DIM6/NTAB) family NADH-FMN oxidoreductase RutF